MFHHNKEFWLALLAVVIITAVYAVFTYWLRAIPAASSLFGHMLGILGFLLMLMTETLYSFRKRSQTARWGSMASWLQFHIFTGLVGPYLVLLHTSWKFNGLAGASTLLTILIVISGFIGRYIYTRIPRTVDGVDPRSSSGQLQVAALAHSRRLMSIWYAIHIPIGMALFITAFVHIGAALYFATLLH